MGLPIGAPNQLLHLNFLPIQLRPTRTRVVHQESASKLPRALQQSRIRLAEKSLLGSQKRCNQQPGKITRTICLLLTATLLPGVGIGQIVCFIKTDKDPIADSRFHPATVSLTQTHSGPSEPSTRLQRAVDIAPGYQSTSH